MLILILPMTLYTYFMLLSLKSIKQIYDVATIIYDAYGVNPNESILLNKASLNELPNAEPILKTLHTKYKVIELLNNPRGEDREYATPTSIGPTKLPEGEGKHQDKVKTVWYLDKLSPYYLITIESNFEEFYSRLENSLDKSTRVTDEALTILRQEYVAVLQLSEMGKPTVTIKDYIYQYNSMQTENAAFKIIHFCLTNYPDEEVSLLRIHREAKDCREITNIRDVIRKSPLFSENGTLSPFIRIVGKSITVYRKLELTNPALPKVVQGSIRRLDFIPDFNSKPLDS
jgi:hypothetical protein